MCGIVGAFTSNPKTYNSSLLKYFKQAIFADTLRGSDSTGVALMNSKLQYPEVFKKALPAPDFLQLRVVDDLLSDNLGLSFMLGHNRHATKGGVSHDTSHPFQYGDITLVHNGTVNNHRQLTEGNKFQVDSEAITNAIDKDGIAAVVRVITGAFTLVWHDASDNTLNFIRNEERPLWLGIVDDGESILMASEGSMLQWLAIRNSIKVTKVFQPAVGMHYKYQLDAAKGWVDAPEVQELPLAPKYTPPVIGRNTTTTTTNYSNSDRDFRAIMKRHDAIAVDNRMSAYKLLVRPVTFVPYNTANSVKGSMHCRPVYGTSGITDVTLYGIDRATFDKLGQVVLEVHATTGYYSGTGNKAVVSTNNLMHPYKSYADVGEYEAEKKLESLVNHSPGNKDAGSKNSSGTGDIKNDNLDSDDLELRELQAEEEERLSGETFRGPYGRYYSRRDMLDLLADGCGSCTGHLAITRIDTIYWHSSGEPLCEHCAVDYNVVH